MNDQAFSKQSSPSQKPFYKKWWFIVIVVLAVFLVVGLAAGGDDTGTQEPSSSNQETSQNNQEASQNTPSSSTTITYEKVDLQTMLDELNENALRAEQKYQGKNIEITGKIASFDSDGSYITIEATTADKWNFDTVMCYIKTQDQKSFLLEKSKGDVVTIKGKVTQIGEFLGYSLNITEIQ